MAYGFTPIQFTVYDPDKTFQENVQNNAVLTKENLMSFQSAIKKASAEWAIGTVKQVGEDASPAITIDFNELEGTRRINFTLPKGEKGEDGKGFTIAKTYATVEEMNSGFCDDQVEEGSFVAIANEDKAHEHNGEIYVKGKSAYTFVLNMQGADGIQGPAGAKGEPGKDGTNGLSAYQIWSTQAGNEGKSEEDFLKSLVGPQGEKGDEGLQGPKGETGEVGPQGEKGDTGKSAYEIWKELPENTSKEEGTEESDFIASLKGEKGDPGTNGVDGKSAYEIWKGKDGNTDKSEDEFLQSLKGDKGDTGNQGPAGTDGKDGKSAYDIWKEQEGHEADEQNEAAFIASLKGATGETGAKGEDGKDGQSAYELWKSKQTSGTDEDKTEEKFLASLKGEKGEPGKDGEQGPEGKSAYDVWKSTHEAPNGEDDFYAALKGPKGDTGEQGLEGVAGPAGKDGQDGKSAFDIWKEKNKQGQDGVTEEEFLASLKGEQGEQGVPGKSAFDIWKDQKDPKPQEGKEVTEKDFLEDLTPKKGVDYFTDEEKEEMEKDVIKTVHKTAPYKSGLNMVYCCGVPVTIEQASETDTSHVLVKWREGAEEKSIKVLSSTAQIFGGDKSLDMDILKSYPSTSITLNSGTVYDIVGGGHGNCNVGVSNVVVNGGTVKNILCGSSIAQDFSNQHVYHATVGKSNVIINGGTLDTVYASSGSSYVTTGEAHAIINGGTVKAVCAGGSHGTTDFGTVTVNNGTVTTVYGANRGTVSSIALEVKGGTVTTLYPGCTDDQDCYATWVHSDIAVTGGNVTDIKLGKNGATNAIIDKVAGFYYDGTVTNTNGVTTLKKETNVTNDFVGTLATKTDLNAYAKISDLKLVLEGTVIHLVNDKTAISTIDIAPAIKAAMGSSNDTAKAVPTEKIDAAVPENEREDLKNNIQNIKTELKDHVLHATAPSNSLHSYNGDGGDGEWFPVLLRFNGTNGDAINPSKIKEAPESMYKINDADKTDVEKFGGEKDKDIVFWFRFDKDSNCAVVLYNTEDPTQKWSFTTAFTYKDGE